MLQYRSVLIPTLLSSVILLSGCQTLGTTSSDNAEPTDSSGAQKTGINKTAAQVGGGVLGGIVGNQFGNGTGKTLMTIAGAVGGAILAGELIGYEDESAASSSNSEPSKTISRTPNDPTLNKYCHKRIKYHKDVPVDVDVAYIRYKRSFGFMTKDENIRSRGLDPATAAKWTTMMDNGYRHVVEPGVRYHMKEQVDLDTGYYIGWLGLELEKAGSNKTRLYVNYCEGGEDGFDSKYSKVIKKKVDRGYL